MDAIAVVEDEVRELVRRRGIDPAEQPSVVRRLVGEVIADYDDMGAGSSSQGAQVDLTHEEVSVGLSDFRVDAAIAVSDVAMARRFYEETLGLVAVEVEDQGVRYQCAEGTRIFVYLSPANAGASSATIAGWFVDDLDQTMDELAERGAVFERYDQPGIKTDERGVFDAGRFRAAWLSDPDGNTLALTQQSGG